jgi:phage-related baseplate assembly protein
VLIAYATGNDLDHLGALFGTARKVMVAADAGAGTAAVLESDADYRRRVQLAPEAFSVAGPAGAYVYYALSAAVEIAVAHAFSPAAGRVTVVIAGADGAPVSDAGLTAVVTRFDGDDTVPLTDVVSVQRAELVAVPVTATLTLARGPDPELVTAEAEAQVRAYFAARYRIGASIYRSGLTAALSVGGVDSVALAEPATDVDVSDTEIAVPGAVTIETNVV